MIALSVVSFVLVWVPLVAYLASPNRTRGFVDAVNAWLHMHLRCRSAWSRPPGWASTRSSGASLRSRGASGRWVAVALGGVFGQQSPLVLVLGKEAEHDCRTDEHRDDPGGIGPPIALQERGLGRTDDLR